MFIKAPIKRDLNLKLRTESEIIELTNERKKLILDDRKNLNEFELILEEAKNSSDQRRISYAETKIQLCKENIERNEKVIKNLNEKIS
jgi:hypothetical protein